MLYYEVFAQCLETLGVNKSQISTTTELGPALSRHFDFGLSSLGVNVVRLFATTLQS